MDSDKIIAEFFGKRLQRFVYQVLAIFMIDRYVFLIRAKAMYLRTGINLSSP